LLAVAGAIVLLAGAACSNSSTSPRGFCLAPASVAIELGVRDSVSGAPLADSASGMVVTVSYEDSLHHTGGDSVLFGGNQTGVYTVTVHHPSYADWVKSGVVVYRTGPCGNVIPVQLDALLVRSP